MRAQDALGSVIGKARFWDALRTASFNDRQRSMLNRLLDGFQGNLTTVKWSKIGKCSHDTALRDIQDLLARGILAQNPGGGRSTSYSLELFQVYRRLALECSPLAHARGSVAALDTR